MQGFSCGLVIDAIDIHAVDEGNRAIFVDRTRMGDKAVRRRFKLERLRVYWEASEKELIVEK